MGDDRPLLDYRRPQPADTRPTGLAVASMVCGIIATIATCVLPLSIPLGVAAVVMGVVARDRCRLGAAAGERMARAGVVCGSIPVVIWVLILIAAFVHNAAEMVAER